MSENESKKMVTVESTSWISIHLEAINNHKGSIRQSDPEFDDNENCYLSDLEFRATRESVDKLYEGLKHFYGHCEGYLGEGQCKYCDMEND